MHAMPAGLPLGIPGIADEIEGAIQQAPQFFRHSYESAIVFPLF